MCEQQSKISIVLKEHKLYDQTLYNNTFRKKHNQMLKEKKICTVCKRAYTYYNKSKHMKQKKHLEASRKLD